MDPLNLLASDLSPGERPHLDALRASVNRGFQFIHRSDPHGRTLAGPELVAAAQQDPRAPHIGLVYAYRLRGPVVDTYIVVDLHNAVGQRVRAEEWGERRTEALWSITGSVAEVVYAVLDLPDPDTPGAPRVARRRPGGGLWLPQ